MTDLLRDSLIDLLMIDNKISPDQRAIKTSISCKLLLQAMHRGHKGEDDYAAQQQVLQDHLMQVSLLITSNWLFIAPDLPCLLLALNSSLPELMVSLTV